MNINENKRSLEVGRFLGKLASMPKHLTEDPYTYMLALADLAKDFYNDAFKTGYGTACADAIIKNSQDSSEKEA